VPSVPSVGYLYDSASRLSTITQGSRTATQTYHPTRGYPEAVSITNSAVPRLTATRTLDNLGRITSVSTLNSQLSTFSSATYDYNAANQRIKATREDGAYWTYAYDSLGQVTSAVKREANATIRPGHNYGYVFDDIGNRKQTTLHNLTSIYAPNALNQYLSRTTPPAIPVLGTAAAATTVRVNDQPATTRNGDWFYHQLDLSGTGAAEYVQFPISATTLQNGGTTELVRSEVRQTYVPPSPEIYEYDADGNLIKDGRWTYSYDAENRLIKAETNNVAQTAGLGRQRLTFSYDAQSRRIGKTLKTYNITTSQWVSNYDTRYLYDGWNLAAEFDCSTLPAPGSLLRSYVWGLDLSGSLQGAGGVGGLLWATLGSANYAPAYDGNGNCVAWSDLATGTKVAVNDYSAFGEKIAISGTDPVPFTFSTKYTDQETKLVYYGFRFVDTSTGRFINRDTIGETGGVNLYAFVENNPIIYWDYLGKRSQPYDWHHNFPQIFEEFFKSKGLTINDQAYGVILLGSDHQAFKDKFNQAWSSFVYSDIGKTANKECVIKHFNDEILPKFKTDYAKATAAEVSYNKWSSMNPARKLELVSPKFAKIGSAVAALGAIATVAQGAEWLNSSDRAQNMVELINAMELDNSDRDLEIYIWAQSHIPGFAKAVSGTLVANLSGKPPLSHEVANRLRESFLKANE
jgi:RHS repeat-associated protein